MAKQYLVSFSVYQRSSGSYSPLPSMSNAKTQIMADSIGYEQRLHSNAAVNKQWFLFARNRFGEDFFAYPLTVKPAYHFDYCGDIEKLNKAGFFDKRIEITKKAGWLD